VTIDEDGISKYCATSGWARILGLPDGLAPAPERASAELPLGSVDIEVVVVHSCPVIDGDRGCEFCADDRNMFYGHVEQVASNDVLGTLLLRCPRCGTFYEQDPQSGSTVRWPPDNLASHFPGVL
jgi:hypothetical protein